ncbi:ATP phosphoribosyltransferase [Cellulosilyticum ruminicola]|uniref:ATP phosphoribosyltransferase n=1 Tax=Cellulosilyticum ruminicola TaxID=425254 RepID=UPI0006D1A4F3|nr:ATP phosphoribosyltransferase [Cellulosilyticum ruminicola]
MEQVTFALAKGRLAKKAMELLKELGITCKEMEGESRKLLFTSDDGKYRFFLSKASDVPTYVDYGVADIGIVGKDTILEENRSVYEVLDLEFGKCKMAVAGKPEMKELLESGKFIRVATKYPAIAKSYFEKFHRPVEIIKLNGSVELGPIVGLSDVIVDIVESGKTLEENGLVVLADIEPLSARCIVNTASMKVKHDAIRNLLNNIEDLRRRENA